MAEDLLRKREVEAHQEDRPVNGMEADDVLTDEVEIRRPELVEHRVAVSVRIIAETGDIVRERVEPYIYDVLRILDDRDAPLEGGSGDAEILETRLQEVVDHLILTGYRLDELRMLVVVLHETVRILAHPEEVSLLTLLLYRASAVRALAVHELRIGPEGLTWGTVPALVLGLVDVALVVHLLEHLLYLLLVVVVGGTDELVVGGVHKIPDGLDVTCGLVNEGLRCHAGSGGLLLDLLAVLVGSGLELDVVALESLVSCDGVGQDDLICVSDMRLAGCIGNRRGDVVRFLFHNTRFPGARMEGDLMYRSAHRMWVH